LHQSRRNEPEKKVEKNQSSIWDFLSVGIKEKKEMYKKFAKLDFEQVFYSNF